LRTYATDPQIESSGSKMGSSFIAKKTSFAQAVMDFYLSAASRPFRKGIPSPEESSGLN
jgi:hypothetical protein